ncbi:MAG: L-threonylcarbamoyladenylate synthase [Patescibacteria group bacterium]
MKKVNIEQALAILRTGGVLIYPTETSYALGCDAGNAEAVERVFRIKHRQPGKGTPVILPPNIDPSVFVEFSRTAGELAGKYWPGPFNIVARRQESSPVPLLCETDGTQSVRLSSNLIASELAKALGRPIVATSANRSGGDSLYTSEEILSELSAGESPDGFLDVGDLPRVPPSTTVEVIGDTVRVLRQGSVILE